MAAFTVAAFTDDPRLADYDAAIEMEIKEIKKGTQSWLKGDNYWALSFAALLGVAVTSCLCFVCVKFLKKQETSTSTPLSPRDRTVGSWAVDWKLQ